MNNSTAVVNKATNSLSQSTLVNQTRQNDARTTNGMVTNSTSLSCCLDLFFLGGASRNNSKENIRTIFSKAYLENKELAIKILFYLRDCRGGAGERNVFIESMSYLSEVNRKEYNRLLSFVPEYGYYKDLVNLFDLNGGNTIPEMFMNAIDNNKSLAAKYLNSKQKLFKVIKNKYNIKPEVLRKRLTELKSVVETPMCKKDYNSINYSNVPSLALNKYRKAFIRNDEKRFETFNAKVADGTETINSKQLFPYDLYNAFLASRDNREHQNIINQWDNLTDYMQGSTERILPVCDVSGSMQGLPMSISVSLGVYISERNQSIFKNAFITFESNPKMEYLNGSTVIDKFNQLQRASWGGSTNLEGTFELILNTAVKNKISSDEMPTKLLIISDMEFNQATRSSDTAMDMIERKYNQAGYQIPEIIFWNVNGRTGNVPAKCNMKRVGLVSGASPSILKSVLQGAVETPEELMLRTINVERYNNLFN